MTLVEKKNEFSKSREELVAKFNELSKQLEEIKANIFRLEGAIMFVEGSIKEEQSKEVIKEETKNEE